ncbi:MAG: SdpI family protein [Candidatus Aureabacteria bacterium]|nr:SdpI family protein [Candidatus Auribacterota bacterium]
MILTLFVYNLVLALIIIILAVPLYKEKIRVNRWYGVRLLKSYESEQIWHRINKLWAKRAFLWASLYILADIIIYVISVLLTPQNELIFILLFSLLPVMIAAMLFIAAIIVSSKIA